MSVISRLGLILFLFAMFALVASPEMAAAEAETTVIFLIAGILSFIFGGNDKCKCK